MILKILTQALNSYIKADSFGEKTKKKQAWKKKNFNGL